MPRSPHGSARMRCANVIQSYFYQVFFSSEFRDEIVLLGGKYVIPRNFIDFYLRD